MTLKLYAIKRQENIRKIVKGFLPRGVVMLVRYLRYRSCYSESFVSCDSRIHPQAKIGRGAIVNEVDIGENVTIGDFTTIGQRCRFNGKGKITVGKFCSLAPEGFYWSENHDLSSVSTYPFEIIKNGQEDKSQKLIPEDIFIGNDVWVGQRACILAGANIGDGCVVAAGSVVPRGIYPPYSVLAGVPARIVRKRFTEHKIDEFLAWRWWDRCDNDIFGNLMSELNRAAE